MASLARLPLAKQLNVAGLLSVPRLKVVVVDPAWQVLISGDPASGAFQNAMKATLGVALSEGPGHVALGAGRVVWMAPGQWLVTSDDRSTMQVPEQLHAAIVGGFVSDVTDGLAVFDLSGPAVRELLAMGCALDFDAPEVGPGWSARTALAEMRVALYCLGDRDRFRLHVDRGLAKHMAEWVATMATAFE